MLWTRAIEMKIRCRANSSTTSPFTRGARPPALRWTTTSRNLPTWSPALSSTGRPRIREMKTDVPAGDATSRVSQPVLGDGPLKDITPLTIRQWYATLAVADPSSARLRSDAFDLGLGGYR